MNSPWDATSPTTAIDTAKAIALVMSGGSYAQLAQHWYQLGYGISQLDLWERSGTRPACFFLRSGSQALFATCGIDSPQQAATLVASLNVPMVGEGSWKANAFALVDAISLQSLLRSAHRGNVSNVVVCGYSYGGALASIVAALQLSRGGEPTMQLLTFGSPRPGDSSLAAVLRQLVSLRYFNDNDSVTHFPPHFNEAPALYLIWPFLTAVVATKHVHIAGGLQLAANGTATSAETSSLFSATAELDLLKWVLSVLGSQSSGHSLLTYIDRLTKMRSALTASGKALPSGAGDEYSAALVPSQAIGGPLAKGAVVQLTQKGKAETMAYFPVNLRPTTRKVLDAYYVYWMGHLVATAATKSTARTIAKYLFKFMREWQRAGAVSVSATTAAVNDFLAVAGSPSQGPKPPFNVVP